MCKTNRAVLNCEAPVASQSSALATDVKAEAGKKGNKTMRKQLLAGAFAAVGMIALAGSANAALFMTITLGNTDPGATPNLTVLNDGTGDLLNPGATPPILLVLGDFGRFSLQITADSLAPNALGTTFQTTILGGVIDDDDEIDGIQNADTDTVTIRSFETGFTDPTGLLSVGNTFTAVTKMDNYIVDWSAWIGPTPATANFFDMGLEGFSSTPTLEQLSPNFEYENAGTFSIIHVFHLIPCTGDNDPAACGGPSTSVGVSFSQTTTVMVVPEPATLAIFGFGLLGLGAVRRRQNSKAA